MNDEALNLSIRKFLKLVGVNSQREIEHAVAKALADGTLAGSESFPARMTLEVGRLSLSVHFDGETGSVSDDAVRHAPQAATPEIRAQKQLPKLRPARKPIAPIPFEGISSYESGCSNASATEANPPW
jgi:hypothetical protein